MNTVKSLLLVEDDPDDQDLFEMALQEVDGSVSLTKAFDGLDALAKLKEMQGLMPDLIVLDINMPRMNGREFLEAIKSDHAFREIPVVLYSTTSESKYVKDIVAMGAKSFFKKPDTFTNLCAELRSKVIGTVA